MFKIGGVGPIYELFVSSIIHNMYVIGDKDNMLSSIWTNSIIFSTCFYHYKQYFSEVCASGTPDHGGVGAESVVSVNGEEGLYSVCHWIAASARKLEHSKGPCRLLNKRCYHVRGVRFRPKDGQIGPKRDKSGTFSDQISVYLNSEKVPDFYLLGPN